MNRTTGVIGDTFTATLAAEDNDEVKWIAMHFTKPNGGSVSFMCHVYQPSGSCSASRTLGQDSDMVQNGTYTYSYMQTKDTWENETADIHRDNPFNVPDLVVDLTQ